MLLLKKSKTKNIKQKIMAVNILAYISCKQESAFLAYLIYGTLVHNHIETLRQEIFITVLPLVCSFRAM
jgi:hypothetical protein